MYVSRTLYEIFCLTYKAKFFYVIDYFERLYSIVHEMNVYNETLSANIVKHKI